jgi:Rad52/22 family double-strand break repair protein
MQVPVQASGDPPAADVEAIAQALSAPFDAGEVKFKPAVVSGNRALALAYVDARVIQDRLDDVLGVMGWQDSYRVLPDGSVMCRLRLKIGEQWITKVDVGGQSEQPDGGDRTKAAFSDALKRAAVKFGVGRYLYRLPQMWADYDPHKRQFVRPPALPASALPPQSARAPKPAPAKPQPAAKGSKLSAHGLPADGADLQRRLSDYDARLSARGVCRPGDLIKHVVQAGVKAGHPADLTAWTGAAIQLAVEETKTFEASRRPQLAARKEVA